MISASSASRLLCLLPAFCVLACTGNVTRLRTEDFVRVTLETGTQSGECAGLCSREMGIEAPGVLVLADSEGTERFDLKPAEYQKALDIVGSSQFRRAMQDPDDCHSYPDGSPVVVVIESTQGEQTDDEVASCVGRPNELTHPYSKLYWLLVKLVDKYLTCPTVDPAAVPDDGKPPVRALCDGCWSWPDDTACI